MRLALLFRLRHPCLMLCLNLFRNIHRLHVCFQGRALQECSGFFPATCRFRKVQTDLTACVHVRVRFQEALPVCHMHMHGAEPCQYVRDTVPVRSFPADIPEAAHVRQLEQDLQAGHRLSRLRHPNGQQPRLCVGRGAVDHICRAFLGFHPLIHGLHPEGPCVHHHGLGGRRGKPAGVHAHLRLTGAHVMPGTIHPGFHPGMVVIAVGPEWHIDLPGRDPAGAQRAHQQHRLLAAASEPAPDNGQRIGCAYVRGRVGGLFKAPAVHFLRRLCHALSPDPLLQRVMDAPVVKDQILIVDPRKEHKGQEYRIGDFPAVFAPHHFSMRADPFQQRVIHADPVRQRQCRFQPPHPFLMFHTHPHSSDAFHAAHLPDACFFFRCLRQCFSLASRRHFPMSFILFL